MGRRPKTTWAQIAGHFRQAAVLADALAKKEQQREALEGEKVKAMVRLLRAVERWEGSR